MDEKYYTTPNGTVVSESDLRSKYGERFDSFLSEGKVSLISQPVYETPNGSLAPESVLKEKYGDKFDSFLSDGRLKKKVQSSGNVGSPSQGGLQGSQVTPQSPSTANPLPDRPFAGLGGVEVPAQTNTGAIGQMLERGPKPKNPLQDFENISEERKKLQQAQKIADTATKDRFAIRLGVSGVEKMRPEIDRKKTEADAKFQELMPKVKAEAGAFTRSLNAKDFTTKDVNGLPIADTEKLAERAKERARELGLPEDGHAWKFLWNEAKDHVSYEIVKPRIEKKAKELYAENYGGIRIGTHGLLTGVTPKDKDPLQADMEAVAASFGIEEKKAKAEASLTSFANERKEVESAMAQEEFSKVLGGMTEEQYVASANEGYQSAINALNQTYAQNITPEGFAGDEMLFNAYKQQHELIDKQYNDAMSRMIDASVKTVAGANRRYNRAVQAKADEIQRGLNAELEKDFDKAGSVVQERMKSVYQRAYGEVMKEDEQQRVSNDKLQFSWSRKQIDRNFATEFALPYYSMLGSSIKAMGTAIGSQGMQTWGDFVETKYNIGSTEIEEWSDWFTDARLALRSTGALAGSMTTSMVPALAVGAATGGLGAGVIGVSLAGGATAFLGETIDLSGRMYDDTFSETGDAALATQRAKKVFDSQLLLSPTYSLEMLPFVGKFSGGLFKRFLKGAAMEYSTETLLQEYPQNAFEDAIKSDAELSEVYKYMTWEGLNKTAMNTVGVIPMGGGGQVYQAIQEDQQSDLIDKNLEANAKSIVAKLKLGKMSESQTQESLLNIVANKGVAQADAVVAAMLSSGEITYEQAGKLLSDVKAAEEFVKKASDLNLDSRDAYVFTNMRMKLREKERIAEADQDPLTKGIRQKEANKLKKDLEDIFEGKDSRYVTLTYPNDSFDVLTYDEARKKMKEVGFADAFKDGEVKLEAFGSEAQKITQELAEVIQRKPATEPVAQAQETPAKGTQSNKQTQAEPAKQPETEVVSESQLNKEDGKDTVDGVPLREQSESDGRSEGNAETTDDTGRVQSTSDTVGDTEGGQEAAVAPKQDAVGEKSVSKFVELEQKLGRKPTESEVFQIGMGTPVDEVVEQSKSKKTLTAKEAGMGDILPDFKAVPTESVTTDEARFQGRESLDESRVQQIVDEFDERKLDPIVAWKDPETGSMTVLSGHHRFEAVKRMGMENVPVREFVGTEQEAIDFARDSNVLGKQESPVERASRYRQLREEGVSEAELQRRARSAHGKDATFMLNLSRLDPKGKAMDAIRQFDESTDKSTRSRIEAVADWMGALKKVHPDVSKAQEAEMFDYLMETYSPKSGKGKISTRNQFVDVASAVIDRMKNNGTFNDGAVLNLGNIAGKGTLEMEYDAKLEEAKQNELDARKNLDEKRKELLVRNASQSQMDKVLLPYEDALRNAIKTVADIRGMKEQAIAGDRAQISLFDEIAEPTTPTDENTERRIERVLEEGRGPQGRTETGTGRGQTKLKKSEGKKSRDAKRDKLKQDIKSLKDDLWNDLNSLGFAATPDKLGKDAQEFTDRLIKLAKLSIQDAGMSLEDFIKEVLSKYTGKRTDVAELSEIAYNAAKDAYIRETAKEMTSTEGRKETDDKFNEAHEQAFEFAESELSGIMNELVPEEKKGVFQKQRRTVKETLERGKAMIQSGAIDPAAFVQVILKSPRPLTADETAAMVYYKASLDARIDGLTKQSNEARESGDVEGVSLAELAISEVEAQMDSYYQFQEASGYEQGLSLKMRQLLITKEYELANQVRKYKRETGKTFVPAEVMAKFKVYDEAIRELSKRIDEFEKRAEEASESLEILSEPDSGETKTKSDAAKLFAKKIRQKKFVKSAKQLATLQSDPTGLFKFAWDSALEFIATTVEQSGSIADAVDGAIKIMTESDWYRKLSDKGKRDFEKIAKPSLSQEAMEYLGITTPTLTDGFLHIPDSFVKDLIRNGFDTIETATTEAKRFMLENLGIDATERQVRDAISDYGKRSKLNKDEVSQKMREMKRVGKLLSALEDVQRKKRPLRSGKERDVMTQKEREIKREISALLKDIPQTSEETDAAWKSALDATKTRLRNRIEDVQKQIEEGKKTPKKKSVELDAEARYLKEEVDRLNEILRSIEGKPEMTFEQRVRITEQAIERSIQEYERRIREKDFEPISKDPVSTPEIEALRTKREQLRKQYSDEYSKSPVKEIARESAAMKRLQKQIDELTEKIHGRISIESKREATKEYGAHVKAMQERVKSLREALRDTEQGKEIAERRALENMKKAANRSIQEYERRIREKDFAVKKSREVALDAEAKSLKAEQQKWKNRFDTEREKHRLDERTKTEKLREGLVDVIGVPKSLVASLDFSSVLRQGGLLSARHPKMAVSAAKEMIKQTFSEAAYERWMDEVIVSDIYNDAKKAGLYIATPNAKLLAKEESFVSNIAEMIPIYGRLVRASNRAYSSYLNVMRIAVFTDFQNQIDKSGLSEKSADMAKKDMAAFINNATGRGSLLGYEPNSPELNILFFSPRFVLSRANIVMNTATGYANYHPKVRKEALLTVAAYASAVTTLILLSTMAGADAEDDPRSSDFGKIRIGKLRLDPFAGLSQMVTFFSRMITGQTKSISTGEVRNLGEGRFGRNRLGVIGSFIRSKMAPIPSAFIDMADSPDGKVKTWGVSGVMEFENKVYFKNIVGEEQTIPERAMSLVTPIYTQGAIEIYQEEGFLMTAAATGSDIIGIGSQYHSTANAGAAETNLSKSQKELEEEMTTYKEKMIEKLYEKKGDNFLRYEDQSNIGESKSAYGDYTVSEYRKAFKDRYNQTTTRELPNIDKSGIRESHNANVLRNKDSKLSKHILSKDGEGVSVKNPVQIASSMHGAGIKELTDEQKALLRKFYNANNNGDELRKIESEIKKLQSK